MYFSYLSYLCQIWLFRTLFNIEINVLLLEFYVQNQFTLVIELTGQEAEFPPFSVESYKYFCVNQ